MINKKGKRKIFTLTLLFIIGVLIIYLVVPDGPGSGITDSYVPLRKDNGIEKEKLRQIEAAMNRNESDALCVMKGNQLLAEAGDEQMVINIASVRKSLLSGLIGIAVNRGMINLEEKLGNLNIDEITKQLTQSEKNATIRDLLKARSGIYLEAIGETSEMKKKRPARGSHAPGTFWYYNNWDFNVLGLIFEKKTSLSIGEAFYQWIAIPTGMK